MNHSAELTSPLSPVQSPPRRAASVPAPAQVNGKPLKLHVMHSIVASIELSDMKELVGTSVMCSLLNAWYLDYFNGTTVDMSYLWPSLRADKGTPFETAALPVVIFYVARSYHGLDVRLPPELMNHPSFGNLRKQAARRMGSGPGFEKVLRRVESQCNAGAVDETISRYNPPRKLRYKTKSRSARAQGTTSKTLWFGLLSTCSLLLALYSLVTIFPTRAVAFSLAENTGILDLQDARVQDGHLNATVTDAAWYDADDDRRRTLLTALADILRLNGIEQISLLDAERSPCAHIDYRVPDRPRIRLGQALFAD